MTAQRATAGQPMPQLPQRSATFDPYDAAPLEASGRSPQVMWAVETLQIMEGLNSLDRIALQLIYWTGLTQAQVAEELGVPIMTVRACVAHGMRELTARFLDDDGRFAAAGFADHRSPAAPAGT